MWPLFCTTPPIKPNIGDLWDHLWHVYPNSCLARLSQLECSYRCVVSGRFSIWEKGWRKNNFHCFVVYFDQIIIKIYKEIYTDNRYNFRSDYFNKYWAYLHFWGRTQCFSIPYLGRGGVCPLLYLPLTIELCIDLTKCIGWL